MKLGAKCGETVLAQKKEIRVNPGEMCSITLDTAKVDGEQVTVEVIKEA